MLSNDDKAVFMETIEARLVGVFSAYKHNSDVPPATLYRLEGYIQAACDLSLVTEEQAKTMIRTLWSAQFSEPFPDSASDRIMIPVMMRRAPVYPSTKD